MKIVVFGPDKRTGVLRDGAVIDLSYAYAKFLRERMGERHPRTMAEAMAPSDLAHLIDGGPRALENAQKAVDYLFGQAQTQVGPRGEKLVYQLSEVKLYAPRPNNARIACAGGNFADHAAAMAAKSGGRIENAKELAENAHAAIRKTGIWGFWKINRDAVEPGGEVAYPAKCTRFDYEGEIAIILGKTGTDIPASALKDHVWGVTLLADWSIRGVTEPGPLKFALQKNFNGSVSLGPCIVVGEIDPTNADVETLVNGERRQRFNTKDMVFSFAEYLEFLSRDLTFYAGDIISGGTAAGTAADSSAMRPDGTSAPERFLKVGDAVEMKSPGIGSLHTRIVAKKNQ
jgi:2-keto-4-pentenoate hydratase/2-oxohepta-3-ene-1,7-dioic acid hydratase in catechol pathway